MFLYYLDKNKQMYCFKLFLKKFSQNKLIDMDGRF